MKINTRTSNLRPEWMDNPLPKPGGAKRRNGAPVFNRLRVEVLGAWHGLSRL